MTSADVEVPMASETDTISGDGVSSQTEGEERNLD
jgi:hypothetical protein